MYFSAQYYCRAFILITGRQINYQYIIATNSSMCLITIFRLYNMEENRSLPYRIA